ncbi:MAG: B12-binding domain-containing radical SAM protein [bacterium]|nr:B12-binding domain-containing radical SAM protein [bacterium]
MNILFLTSAAPAISAIPTTEKRPPLGMGYLMAVLKKQGHTIFFSDEYLKPSNILDSDFLQRKRIDFVGIYSNTICYASTLEMFEKLQAKREQGQWKGKIMVGGPHTSFGHNEIPPYVDFIVIGEGEITVPKIVNGEIKERIVRGEKVDELDSLPFPAWEEFIHLPYMWWDRRIEGTPLYTFNTSRGCPFACTFCSVKGIWGKSYRYMSVERVLHDVEYMKKVYGLKAAYFREDHFTLNRNRTMEFCEGLLKKTPITWMCESRVDCIDDPAVVETMAKSGCRALYIGVESGSPRMLELLKKEETVEQFIRVFDYAKKYGINTHASFVVGVPGETEEDTRLTEDLIRRIQPDTVRKNVYVGLPGSEIYDHVKSNQLYDFEDKQGILYLKGHNEKVEKYYGGNPALKAYDPQAHDKEQLQYHDFKRYRRIDDIAGNQPGLDDSLLEKRFIDDEQTALLDAYLEEIVSKVWRDNSNEAKGKIALYGAGTHTILLLDIIQRLNLEPPAVVFDNNPKGALVKNITVAHIDNISAYNITCLIISNDRRHYEIQHHLAGLPVLKDIAIINPYLYLPHAPYRNV